MWIDSHTHLNDEAFENDYKTVIERAITGGVEAMIVVGFDLSSSRRALQLAQEYKQIWAAVGVHPHDAKTWSHEAADGLRGLLTETKVVAVGEIGLDYHYNYSPKEDQLKAFKEQLQIAKEYNKPIIIHNREAPLDTLTLLKQEKLGKAGGVMHCFNGSWETAVQCLDLGLHISFAGPLTFTNAVKSREIAAKIPINRLLIETDCPYLTPHPFRGQRNEPLRVALVGEKLAEIKEISTIKAMQILAENTKDIFGIS